MSARAGAKARPSDLGSSHLFGRGLLYVIVSSLQLLAATIVSPILAYALGPTEFGAFASALALHQVLSVLALLGLDQALVLQRSEEGDPRNARGLAAVGIAVSLVVAGVAGLTAPLWRDALGFGDYPVLVLAVVLWTAPVAAVQVMLALLLAEDRLRGFAIVSALAAVGGQVAGLVLLFTVHRDAATYAFGGVISQVVAMLLALVLTRPLLRGLVQWRIAGRAIRLGVPLALGGLAMFVLNAGDRVVVQRFLGPEEVGRYQIAYVVGSVVILLLTFTSTAWTPRFAALSDEVERWALAVHSRDELYRLLMPMLVGITLAAPTLLRIVAPASFRPDSLTAVAFLVAVAAFPVAASGATGRLLITLRRGSAVGTIACVAAVANIALNIALVPVLGIAGSAAATVLAFMLLAYLQWRALPVTPAWRRPPTRLVVAVAATIVLSGATVLLPQTLIWNVARLAVAAACLPWFLVALGRARRGGAAPDSRDGAGPEPVLVLALDLDGPLPVVPRGTGYGSALVVGWRAGTPVAVADADLRDGSADLAEQLAHLRHARVAPGSMNDIRVLDEELPSVSVVVSTIVERVEELTLLLDAFGRLDYPRVEFIVVDNRTQVSEDDPLPGLVSGRAAVRVVPARRPGISAGRNAGIAAATGDIVVFTDDDVQVDSGWLRAFGRRFTLEPSLRAVTGLILPAELETPAQIWFERYYGGFSGERTFTRLSLAAEPTRIRALRGSRITVRDEQRHRLRDVAVYGIGAFGAGANMAFRRSELEALGGFDTRLGTGTPSRGGEDLAMIINVLWAGGEVGFEPTAVVHHRHRSDLAGLRHQLRGNGVGFTAMLTALIWGDRRHLVTLAAQLPLALVQVLRQSVVRLAGSERRRGAPRSAAPAKAGGTRFPRSLVLNEIGSYPKGPGAYLRSRRAAGRAASPRPSKRVGEVDDAYAGR